MSFETIQIKSLFESRNDPTDVRLGDLVKFKAPTKATKGASALLGYPDDEGISLSRGRLGARLAPDKIRHYLYKMTPSLLVNRRDLFDIGNIENKSSLEERHEIAAQKVESLLQSGFHTIGIGGGHDYGYSDGIGFLRANRDSKIQPLIINIDAHLDVRNIENGVSSGTPFYRLLESEFDFELFEIGIQDQCNSRAHYEWVTSKNAKIITLDEITIGNPTPLEVILNRMSDALLKRRPCYFSVDLDGFSSAFAPGCSQVFPSGLDVTTVVNLLKILCYRLDVQTFGVYETSPPLDTDDQTSRLAALLIHRFISNSHHCVSKT